MVLLPEPDTPITTSAHGMSLVSSLTKILRKRSLVHKPDGLARGMHAVRRQVLARQHPRQDRTFVRTRNLEQHFAAGAEHRHGQRYPRDKWLDMRLGDAHHPVVGLFEGWIIRK